MAPIRELEQSLMDVFNNKELQCSERTEEIKSLMTEYIATQKDWQKYCFFSDVHYTRNLVVTNDKFELIVRIAQKPNKLESKGERMHCCTAIRRTNWTTNLFDAKPSTKN